LLLCAALPAHAQQPAFDTIPRADRLLLNRPWLQTNNAAGWGLSQLPAAGQTSMGGQFIQGDFHRAQQPESTAQLLFFSEGYRPVKKGMIYGSFSYNNQQDRNIRMSDVMDPYRGTPYLLADSIGGDWKKQSYALRVKAATGPLWQGRLRLGTGIDYKVATGARQNDPRPLNTVNDITITPGITWNIHRNSTIGINGLYGAFQESISIQNKNTDRGQLLYKLLGLGQYELPTTILAGATRYYKGKKYGGDAQYHWQNRQWELLGTLGYGKYREEATDGTIIPLKGGTLEEKQTTAAAWIGYTTGKSQHRVLLNYDQYDRVGVETQYTLNRTTNIWEVVLEAPFTTSFVQTGRVAYEWNTPALLLHAGVTYNGIDNKYLFPVSTQTINNLTYTIAARGNYSFKNGNSLEAGLSGGFTQSLEQQLDYRLMTTTTNLVANQVLYPDHAYLTADVLRAGVQLQYNFRYYKAPRTLFFIRAQTMLDKPMNNDLPGSRSTVLFSIGAFY
jgi:hypothetical protein